MQELTTLRLYVLRGAYLLIAVGLALMIWPRLISHTSEWALKNGDVAALLGGVQVLCLFGLRYPVKMLPVLLFEFVWKSIWLLAIYLPLSKAGFVDADTRESFKACALGVIVCLIAIPWPYVLRAYVIAPADRWRSIRTA